MQRDITERTTGGGDESKNCRREGSKIFMVGKAALYSIDELFVGA